MLSIGLGFAVSKITSEYFFEFILESADGEFTLDYIIKSVSANCEISQIMAFTCLVWVSTNGNKAQRLIAWLLISLGIIIFPMSEEILISKKIISSFSSFILEIFFSICSVIITKLLVDLTLV